MGKVKRLPDKLSKLILLALADLEMVEKNPLYRIEMTKWHQSNGDLCKVCFAGAVMARSLKCSPQESFNETDFDIDTTIKLQALNEIRVGHIGIALNMLNIPNHSLRDVFVASIYSDFELQIMSHDNLKEWKLHMQDIAGILAAEGL